MQSGIVPHTEHTTYLLLDEMGKRGPVWRETAEREANEVTIMQWLIQGQFNRALKIIAFNTEEGWSRDVTYDVATKLLEINLNAVVLGTAAGEFIERVTGQSATAVV